MFLALILVCATISLHTQLVDCIECYSCANASLVSDCKTIIQCASGSVCHMNYTTDKYAGRKYNLGCSEAALCPLTTTNSPTNQNGGSHAIVGRSVTLRTTNSCAECCETNNCNRQLCQDQDPTCQDSTDFNCALVGSAFDVCAQEEHANTSCRRFCGLCSISGGWTNWGDWTSCSVTCDNGTETRTRACTNPAPANGGSDCKGVTRDTRVCLRDQCPVNGGWSQWSPWGSCSVSRGVGMQRRDRSCSNPFPSNSGSHCFGDSRDDRICMPGAFQDGGWTDWGTWSSCSQSCDNGIRTRSRTCTNPSPSLLGNYCKGDPNQVQTCVLNACSDTKIGFTVKNPKDTGTSGHITFSEVVTNIGGGYNTATGVFTCRISGLYYFSLNLLKESSSSVNRAHCSIYKNDTGLVDVYVDPASSADGGYYPATNSVYVHLTTGDQVKLRGCSPASTMFEFSSFTGFLIKVD